MSPLDRLLAEAVPDGTFGGARQLRTRKPEPAAPRTSPAEAARHLAELAAAIARPRPV